jgi:D-alanine-D-alanine ligase
VSSLGQIDVALPLLHGPYGEDGTIQGALELLDIDYVGSGTLASAVGMDKIFSKTVFKARGLPVARWVPVTAKTWPDYRSDLVARINQIGWPVFVKPCRAGSSLGVSKVLDQSGLDQAIETAFRFDQRILVEQAQSGRELECAVLGGHDGGGPRAAGPAEVVMQPGHDVYSFEAKYLDGTAADLRCPADLPAKVGERVRVMAANAFLAIGAQGLSRVDLFYDSAKPEGQDLVINEINTMPGFTPISLFPRMWAGAGLDYTSLISELIDLALELPPGLR